MSVTPTPVVDLRVVEISDRIAGAYCGKLLTDAGADVVKLEPTGGDPLRRFTVTGAVPPDGVDAPLFSYLNADSWTDRPFSQGVILIGDAAGWNDPIIGQGLSVTYRDVRIVSEILKAGDDWSTAAFGPYSEERAERMRRLRFAASLTAATMLP